MKVERTDTLGLNIMATIEIVADFQSIVRKASGLEKRSHQMTRDDYAAEMCDISWALHCIGSDWEQLQEALDKVTVIF